MKASEAGLAPLLLVLANTNTTICHEAQNPMIFMQWALMGLLLVSQMQRQCTSITTFLDNVAIPVELNG